MAKKPVKYAVVDAFTDTAFKGNPAAVCLLEEEDTTATTKPVSVEEEYSWLQSVATEFNISQTAFLTYKEEEDHQQSTNVPRFRLRWFTPVAEVKLCGHATLAAAHFLFCSGLVKSGTVEFSTLSGVITAKRVAHTTTTTTNTKSTSTAADSSSLHDNGDGFLIELNFPVVPITEFDEEASVSKSLNGVSAMDIKKTLADDVFVEFSSGKSVAEFQPQFDEIQKCPGRGLIITGLAPPGSGFDFFSRFFCPKLGINEDPVCGSAHCALAPYWCKKLGKCDLVAYQASPRGGTINLHVDEKNQRVLLRGKAITVMEGSLLV